jgi:hypothetical protein
MPVSVTGIVKQVRPTPVFAVVNLSATPHTHFEVITAAPTDRKLAQLGFPEFFVFGLLDVLMTDEYGPLTGLRAMLDDVKYHDIDTNSEAFVRAGRNAAKKLFNCATQRLSRL